MTLTDEIAMPMTQHTKPPDFEVGFAEDCAGKVHHVIDHDYICSL